MHYNNFRLVGKNPTAAKQHDVLPIPDICFIFICNYFFTFFEIREFIKLRIVEFFPLPNLILVSSLIAALECGTVRHFCVVIEL